MRRWQLADSGEGRLRARHVLIREVCRQCFEIRPRLEPRVGKKGFRLGRERDAIAVDVIVQGLLADPIARDEQAPPPSIPQRQCKHAAEAVEAADAPFTIGGENDLSVGPGMENVAASFQLSAQFQEVVDFSVERDIQVAIRRRHGLAAGVRQIDDRQAAMAQTDGAVGPYAVAVGAAMRDEIAHRPDRSGVHRTPGLEVEPSRDPAHQQAPDRPLCHFAIIARSSEKTDSSPAMGVPQWSQIPDSSPPQTG